MMIRIILLIALGIVITSCGLLPRKMNELVYSEFDTGSIHLGLRSPTPVIIEIGRGPWIPYPIGPSKVRFVQNDGERFINVEITGVKRSVFTSVIGNSDEEFTMNWVEWESNHIQASYPGHAPMKSYYNADANYSMKKLQSLKGEIVIAAMVIDEENVITVSCQTNDKRQNATSIIKGIMAGISPSSQEQLDQILAKYNKGG